MKYISPDKNSKKSFIIPVADKGINLSKRPDDIDEGQLSACKNVWIRGGRVESRPGLSADAEKLIGGNITGNYSNNYYTLTDTAVFVDGKYNRIVYARNFYDESNCFVYVYLIDRDDNITDIGNMHFARADEETFFVPVSITFYTGKSQNGGGIFAFITLVNMEGFSERIYYLYEVNSALNAWSRNTDYYIPTVYINGRGNSYKTAEEFNSIYTEKPIELEALNLLDGRFYAYFSSDSYSSSFELPYSQLADETVICRVYRNSETYTEWTVSSGSDTATERIGTDNVTMLVDREKGEISFLSSNNNYAIPQMYGYLKNNIKISAVKRIENSFENVASCTLSAVFNSKTLFSKGLEGSKIYYTSYDNPLYFPQVEENTVGHSESEVTAIIPVKNKLIAFKESEIYSVEIKEGESFNKTTWLADNPDTFFNADSYKMKCITRNIGCKFETTLANAQGELIWLANNGGVYSLHNDSVYELSKSVKPYLDFLQSENDIEPTAVGWENNYLLCFGRQAVIMQYSSGDLQKAKAGPAFYIWEFPYDCFVTGAFSYQNKPHFIFEDIAKTACYPVSLSGETDGTVTISENTAQLNTVGIESSVTTKSYYLQGLSGSVKIDKIFLSLCAEDSIHLKINSGECCRDFILSRTDLQRNKRKAIKLNTNMKIEESLSITLESSYPFSFGKAEVSYTENKF